MAEATSTLDQIRTLSTMTGLEVSPLAWRLLALLETRRGEFAKFDTRIDKYQHSLQCATRARKAGEPADYVVMCLFHDVFGGFEPLMHGNMAGVTLRPFISKRALMACYEHPFAVRDHLAGVQPTDIQRESAGYEFAVTYDIPSFDPNEWIDALPTFLPEIAKVIKA